MKAWKITNQTQTEHLGDYCTLSIAIAYDGGELRVAQRIADTGEGYAEGQARARLIAAAPNMLKALKHIRLIVSPAVIGADECRLLDEAIKEAVS